MIRKVGSGSVMSWKVQMGSRREINTFGSATLLPSVADPNDCIQTWIGKWILLFRPIRIRTLLDPDPSQSVTLNIVLSRKIQ